jgi:hypothetical protein
MAMNGCHAFHSSRGPWCTVCGGGIPQGHHGFPGTGTPYVPVAGGRRLSDADVERIAQRVAELLREAKQ